MSVDIRFPNITAPTEAGKLQQVQSFLHQLVEQLNWALNNIDSISAQAPEKIATAAPAAQKDDPVSTFSSIKGLIIKSADIVNAYYEEINNLLKLNGEYVAEATFPDGSATFVENTSQAISANSKSIEAFYKDIQSILSDIESIGNQLIEVTGHIKSGVLFYDDAGLPVYGLEIGQRNTIDNVEVFNKYARFTANKLSFYDSNDNEVAYISDRKLFITIVQIGHSLIMGGFVDEVQSDMSIVTKWGGT